MVSHRFVIVAAVFITCLITSNIIAVKLIDLGIGPVNIGGLQILTVLPVAVIVFPISYIVGDILTEVYGYNLARRVIWLGFVCNLFAVVVFWTAGLLPAIDPDVQGAYKLILG